MKKQNRIQSPVEGAQREVVVVPVGTPEEADQARRRALRILADWVQTQLQAHVGEEEVSQP